MYMIFTGLQSFKDNFNKPKYNFKLPVNKHGTTIPEQQYHMTRIYIVLYKSLHMITKVYIISFYPH